MIQSHAQDSNLLVWQPFSKSSRCCSLPVGTTKWSSFPEFVGTQADQIEILTADSDKTEIVHSNRTFSSNIIWLIFRSIAPSLPRFVRDRSSASFRYGVYHD